MAEKFQKLIKIFLVPTGSMAVIPVFFSRVRADDETGTRLVKPSELPIYDRKNTAKYDIVPQDESAFMLKVSELRQVIWKWLDSVQTTTDNVKQKYGTAKAHTVDLIHHIQNDPGFLPRAGLIGVAGLGGVIAGYRGGKIKKTLYASIGVLSATSLCYPHQAVSISIAGKDRLVELWEKQVGTRKLEEPKIEAIIPQTSFQKAPDGFYDQGLQEKENKSKVEVDMGQSSADDKDMYTTRS